MTTVLFMDDFGLPHGRFLERASVGAGATLLSAPDGGLRAVDVGKRVAIPGAADLQATTASLVRRKDVTGRMIAGQNRLVATFPAGDNERFQERVHRGLRITVAGAGPGGSTLVTDVQHVQDPVTLELAAAAAADVNGAETILNDPSRILLSDHARASGAGLTIDLGDRVVDDAAMTIGQVALTSATARFSSLDLDKPVVASALGRHVTTIASVQNGTTATLTEPAPRAVVDVPADVWLVTPADQADVRPAFEDLLASLAAADVESAEIRFGNGVYDFTPDTGSGRRGGISLRGLANLTLRGSGPGATILRLRPDQDLPADAHVMRLRDCRRICVRDMSVHGAYLTMGRVNEQMHGVFVAEGCEEIAVQRVRVHQTAGDGIRLLGSATERVRRIWIDGCRLVQNKRSGIAFQRAVEQVWVRDCVIEMTPPSNDQCIDFEPSGNPNAADLAPRDIVIDANMMVHGTTTGAVALSGLSNASRLRNVRFTSNVLIGGSIFVTDVDGLVMCGNIVVVPASGPARIPLHVYRGGREMSIVANLLVNENPDVEAVLWLGRAGGRGAERVVVADNVCRTVAGSGILLQAATDVVVSANTVVATGAAIAGVDAVAQNAPLDAISLRDNHISADGGGWESGIRVDAGQSGVDDISIVGNVISGAADGVVFRGADFRRTPICALNQLGAGVVTPLVGLDQLPGRAVLAGGAVGRGGPSPVIGAGRQLTGIGDPAGAVLGNVGDIYLRLDGAPGQTLYVKETGNDTDTGWVAK